MHSNFNDGKLIYLQIASMIEDDILREVLLSEEQVPSTNELSRRLQINPATAAKGVNILIDEGILYKKRGIGMFVTKDSKKIILQKRKAVFKKTYVQQMLKEAAALNITKGEVIEMIEEVQGENTEN